MKKILLGLLILIILCLATIYTALFTTFGNEKIALFVENKVNQTSPINFKINKFLLNFDNLDFKASIDETPIIEINGNISPLSLELDLQYLVDIKDLSILEKLIGQKLKGNFKTNGEIKGNKNLLLINGETDIFSSASKYDVVLKNFEIANIGLVLKNMSIREILHTVNQPLYADGKVDVEGEITNVSLENLAGEIITKVYDGVVNDFVVNDVFELKLLGNKAFNGQINTILKPMLIDNKIDFKTSFANIETKSTRINLEDTSIETDYKISVDDLNNLFDLTQIKLVGNVVVDGKIKKSKDLEIEGVSNILDGVIDFKLLNENLTANVKEIEISQLTKMLDYKDFFSSKANANLNYNLATKEGEIKTILKNGQFLPTQFSNLVNTFANFDITKEVYESVDFVSQINNKSINSQVSMKNEQVAIDIPNSKFDFESKTIDALVDFTINKHQLATKITGNIAQPKFEVLVSQSLQNAVEQRIEEKIQDELGEDGLKLLDSIKSIF